MNQDRLYQIIKNYIEQFDYLNAPDPGPDEKYKWEIAYGFRGQMDDLLASSADTLPDKLSTLVESASNLLQNQFELPGAALRDYSKREPETVRALLSTMFEEDNGDLEKRQTRIEAFITGCNALKKQYFPDSFKYEMGQRAAMVLLGLYDPENNYLYKATQANEFADCVEFYDDWGPSTHFKLPIYYRMCDQLVEYLRADDELLTLHQSRYQNPPKPLHEDRNLHILAFDIIYCSTVYHLMNNIEYDHISSGERKKYLDNQKTAEALAAKLEDAIKAMDLFREAVDYYKPFLAEGSAVTHKAFGAGVITSYEASPTGNRITVRFGGDVEKTFIAEQAIVNGFLSINTPDLKERNVKYRAVILKGETTITNEVARAEEALKPYQSFLM